MLVRETPAPEPTTARKSTSRRSTGRAGARIAPTKAAATSLTRFVSGTAHIGVRVTDIANLGAEGYKKWTALQLQEITRFRSEIALDRSAKTAKRRRRMSSAIHDREHAVAVIAELRRQHASPASGGSGSRGSSDAIPMEWTLPRRPPQSGPLTQNYYLNPLDEK